MEQANKLKNDTGVQIKVSIPKSVARSTNKPKKKKRKIYFGKDVQNAIIECNNLNPDLKHQRDRLFNTVIYPAFMKLTENIINTWKFHRYETNFTDLQLETVSELYQKMPGYNPEKGRAYSYFTIIAKHFLIKRSKQIYAATKAKTDLVIVDAERNLSMERTIEGYQESLKDFISHWCNWCEYNLGNMFRSSRDQKVADAIIELFRTSDDIDIYNKKLLYVFIRERANVDTQHITKVVKVMRTNFVEKFEEYKSNGFIVSL